MEYMQREREYHFVLPADITGDGNIVSANDLSIKRLMKILDGNDAKISFLENEKIITCSNPTLVIEIDVDKKPTYTPQQKNKVIAEIIPTFYFELGDEVEIIKTPIGIGEIFDIIKKHTVYRIHELSADEGITINGPKWVVEIEKELLK